MTEAPEYPTAAGTIARVVTIVTVVVALIITITYFYIRSIDSRTAAAIQPADANATVATPDGPAGSNAATYSSTSEMTPAPGNAQSIVDNGALRLCGIDSGSLAKIRSTKPNEAKPNSSENVRNSCLIYREPEQQYIEVTSLKAAPELAAQGNSDPALPPGWIVAETGIASVFLRDLTHGWVAIDTAKPTYKYHEFVSDFDALLADAQLI